MVSIFFAFSRPFQIQWNPKTSPCISKCSYFLRTVEHLNEEVQDKCEGCLSCFLGELSKNLIKSSSFFYQLRAERQIKEIYF